MSRYRFSITSEQLELLLAFEESQGLLNLSEKMGRDPSVISRRLQRIAEDFPVLVKVKGRWELTPLGRQLNEQTRDFTIRLHELLPRSSPSHTQGKIRLSDNSVLLIINAQRGIADSIQERRSNIQAEQNIICLLELWRKKQRTVVHIKHISDQPYSVFFKEGIGCEILPELTPRSDEPVFEKKSASAFQGTLLAKWLGQINAEELVIVGFTANECIDSSVKDAAALGFASYVVGDATSVFDMRGADGKLIRAERLHKLTLENINAFYAKVIQTADVLSS